MDASELAPVVAELTQAVTDIQASRYLAVAGFIVLIYDHISTLSDEVQLIWQKPISLVSALFLVNRYTVPIIISIDMFDKGGLARNLPNSVVALRVRALWGNRRWVNAIIIAVGGIYFTITIILNNLVDANVIPDLYWNTSLNLCFGPAPWWTFWTFVPALVFETMLFALTLGKAVQDRKRDLSFSDVAGVLYRDGIVYFLVISSCSVFNIVVWAALRPSLVALAKYFTFSFVNVMASRLVLNLRALRRDPDDQFGEEILSGGSFSGDRRHHHHHPYDGRHLRGPANAFAPASSSMPNFQNEHNMAGKQIALRKLSTSRRVRSPAGLAGQISFIPKGPGRVLSPPPRMNDDEKPTMSITTSGSGRSSFESNGLGTTSVRVQVDVDIDIAVDVDFGSPHSTDMEEEIPGSGHHYSTYSGVTS
ncbi:hypothetical protein FRB95_002997 [Tulasnella sp. JGI-2019a]|nr:hypothetical protein FRB95_002997 [Tulasnella sp. JGI-2019a]